MKKLIVSLLLAAVLWTIMFSPMTAPYVPFWWTMTASACGLAVLSGCFHRRWWKGIEWRISDLFLGVGSAVVLWGIFWCGDKLAVRLFDFARPQVDSIYGMKSGEPSWVLAALMFFLIGPAEEIFWRGYVQRTFSERWNPAAGFVTATFLYAAVHMTSCNFMLVAAAGVAGGIWGWYYRFFPHRLPVLILSHALWDVGIFLFFPI